MKITGGLSMYNNDILIRVRYALDIKDVDMVEIFKLGGIEVTKEEVLKMLTKSNDDYNNEIDYEVHLEKIEAQDEHIKCSDFQTESFLNGLIIFKRGRQESKPIELERTVPLIKDGESINNEMLKKLKIALSLTSEDILAILESAGLRITKGELSAVLRKEGHRNYKVCGDKYARNFLKGLAIKYRG